MAKSRRGRKRHRKGKRPKLSAQPAVMSRRGDDSTNVIELAMHAPHRKRYASVVNKRGAVELTNAKCESELGRLSLDGVIGTEEYEGCCRFRRVVANARRAIDAPASTARSSAAVLVAGGGGSFAFDDERAADVAAKAITDYQNVTKFLVRLGKQTGFGRDIFLALYDIIIDDRERFEARGGILAFQAGAAGLVNYWGLSTVRATRN